MLTQTRFAWIGLIIVISFGLAIETLKSTRNSHNGSAWRPRIFGLQDFPVEREDDQETTPERSVKAERARSRLLKGRIAGLDPKSVIAQTMPTAVFAAQAGPPIPNLTPLKLTASDEDKKKAEAAKKKKKKKKKATEAVAQLEQPASAPPTPDKKKDSSFDVTGNSNMTGGGTQRRSLIAGNIANDKPGTLEQWLAYILREPSYERTVRLLQANQSRTLDSEIFYEVLKQMLADSRPKMHEFAIYALGSSPSLRSFLLLETANLNEPQGSLMKTQSRTYLKAYARLENLRFLAGAIASSNESSTMLEALKLIQTAVIEYKPKSTPSTGPTTSSVQVSKQFSTLLPVLTRAVQMASDDATLRQEASTTLQQVQTLVGSHTIPAA